MATTTNYGWTTPDDTSLVKDGASAIRTLGSAIDTSLNTALGTKKAGLVLLNTTSFSAVASQSINNVFSSTYDSYRIIIRATQNTGAGNQFFRLRVGGVDSSSANYQIYGQYSGFTSGVTRVNQSGVTGVDIGTAGNAATYPSVAIIELTDVAKATPTYGFWNAYNIAIRDSAFVGFDHSLSTAYDGFTWQTSANTITGQIQVFGYNK